MTVDMALGEIQSTVERLQGQVKDLEDQLLALKRIVYQDPRFIVLD